MSRKSIGLRLEDETQFELWPFELVLENPLKTSTFCVKKSLTIVCFAAICTKCSADLKGNLWTTFSAGN